jgi:hypothetical protein
MSPTPTPSVNPPAPTPDEAAVKRARGVLAEQREGTIVFSKPGTDYRLHLHVLRELPSKIGHRIAGTIRANGRRIDIVRTGGRFIEPVYGEPRQIQGDIVHIDKANNTVTVNAGVPIVCKVHKLQRADQFKQGDFVNLGVESGTSFSLAEA